MEEQDRTSMGPCSGPFCSVVRVSLWTERSWVWFHSRAFTSVAGLIPGPSQGTCRKQLINVCLSVPSLLLIKDQQKKYHRWRLQKRTQTNHTCPDMTAYPRLLLYERIHKLLLFLSCCFLKYYMNPEPKNARKIKSNSRWCESLAIFTQGRAPCHLQWEKR